MKSVSAIYRGPSDSFSENVPALNQITHLKHDLELRQSAFRLELGHKENIWRQA